MSGDVGKKGSLENLRIVKVVAGGGEIPLTGLGRRKVEKVEGRAGEYVQVSSMDHHSPYMSKIMVRLTKNRTAGCLPFIISLVISNICI